MTIEYDVLVITETWLNYSVLEAELTKTNFVIYRQDRPEESGHDRGGGVLIGINKKLVSNVTETLEISNPNYEQLYVTVIKECNKYIIGAVYIPSPSIQIFQDFTMYVQDLKETYLDSNLIVIGDFNLTKVIWSNNRQQKQLIHSYQINTDKNVIECNNFILDFMEKIGLEQKNHIKNINGNVLDLIFVKCKNVNIQESVENLLNVDVAHPVLDIQLTFECLPIINQSQNLNFEYQKNNYNKANYDSINLNIDSHDWKSLFQDCNIEEAVNKFYLEIFKIIDTYVPKITIKSSDYPVWFDLEIIKLILEKKIS